MNKVIKIDPPQWRTVLRWITWIFDTHAKVSWNRKNINGTVPAKNVLKLLQGMARAADLAAQLQKENKQLKKQLRSYK